MACEKIIRSLKRFFLKNANTNITSKSSSFTSTELEVVNKSHQNNVVPTKNITEYYKIYGKKNLNASDTERKPL